MTNKDSKDKYKQHNKRGKYFMLSDIQIKAIHGMENSEILPCTPRSIDFWITFFLNSCSSDFWNMITSCGHLWDPTFVIVFLGPCSSLHFFSYEHFCRMQPLFLCSPFLCHILSPFVMNGILITLSWMWLASACQKQCISLWTPIFIIPVAYCQLNSPHPITSKLTYQELKLSL